MTSDVRVVPSSSCRGRPHLPCLDNTVYYEGRVYVLGPWGGEWPYQVTWSEDIVRPLVAPQPWGGDGSPLLVMPGRPPST